MTRSSSNTVIHEAGRPQSGRAGIATAAPPFRRASPFYVEEPDIPEGVTCAAWRRGRQRVAKRGLLAHVPRLYWHQLKMALP